MFARTRSKSAVLTEIVTAYISKETKAKMMADATAKNITLAELLRQAIVAQQQESVTALAA